MNGNNPGQINNINNEKNGTRKGRKKKKKSNEIGKKIQRGLAMHVSQQGVKGSTPLISLEPAKGMQLLEIRVVCKHSGKRIGCYVRSGG